MRKDFSNEVSIYLDMPIIYSTYSSDYEGTREFHLVIHCLLPLPQPGLRRFSLILYEVCRRAKETEAASAPPVLQSRSRYRDMPRFSPAEVVVCPGASPAW